MDKRLWLEVIRKELELLDKLATGMMEESHLEQEEIELAITRSALVTREFELLRRQKEEIIVQNRTVGIVEPLPVLTQIEVELTPDIQVVDLEVPAKVTEDEKDKHANVSEDSSEIADSGEPTVSMENNPEQLFTPPQPSVPEKISEIVPSIEIITEQPIVVDEPLPKEVSSPITTSAKPLSYRTASTEYFALEKEEHRKDSPLFKPAPIKSLKDGLTLNDRYLFQRELFNNDKIKLDQAIATLDRLDNIQEAVGYLKANYRWTKNEASEKFVLLVKRRFMEKG